MKPFKPTALDDIARYIVESGKDMLLEQSLASGSSLRIPVTAPVTYESALLAARTFSQQCDATRDVLVRPDNRTGRF